MVNIEKLEELTAALRYSRTSPRDMFVDTPTSPAHMRGLRKNKDIAVSDVFVPRGGDTTFHCHQELEILVIYEGECIVQRRGLEEQTTYTAPSVVQFQPEEEHKILYTNAHCKMIAISIPASDAWPEGE